MIIWGVLPKCKVLFVSGHANYSELLADARAKGFNFVALQKTSAAA
jgi:hypothetical protein